MYRFLTIKKPFCQARSWPVLFHVAKAFIYRLADFIMGTKKRSFPVFSKKTFFFLNLLQKIFRKCKKFRKCQVKNPLAKIYNR